MLNVKNVKDRKEDLRNLNRHNLVSVYTGALKFILTIDLLSVNFEKSNIKECPIGGERFCG